MRPQRRRVKRFLLGHAIVPVADQQMHRSWDAAQYVIAQQRYVTQGAQHGGVRVTACSHPLGQLLQPPIGDVRGQALANVSRVNG
jgi:hypothetical protein